MGYLSAFEIREYLSENQALTWHLQYNHYPPISLIFLPAVRAALEAARDSDLSRRIELPTGKIVTAGDVVEQVHLQAFLDSEEDS